MNKKLTVTVGDQEYDAVTGLPVSQKTTVSSEAAAPVSVRHTPSTHLHSPLQRSQTLQRKFTKKPTGQRTAITTHHAKPAPAVPVAPAVKPLLSPQVRRFAPHPVGATKIMDIGPASHPHVVKAHARSAAKEQARQQHVQSVQRPAATIKQQAVARAVENTKTDRKEHKTRFWQRQKVASVLTATFALVLLGGYFTYLNIPSLSVRVAAAQAGINASYPDYRPDGYALSGPVTYSDGRVSMNFKATTSDANFTVNQSKSSWDSNAVLDNYVTPKAGSSYMPYTERGLTIYTYNNSAAWVNGGILYTVEGDAPLSSEQIRRIATSLL